MHALTRCLATCLLLACAIQTAAAKGQAEARTEAGNDYYAGGELRIDEPVAGDLFAAGGTVSLRRGVGADATVVGGMVTVRAPVGQDLRVAGGEVTIRDAVEGELAAAGGSVTLAESANVSGSALLAGGEVTVNGRVGKGARIYAGEIAINGNIEGDVRLYAPQIAFGPNARIDGNLFYASAEPLPDEQLQKVSGRVVRERTPKAWTGEHRSSMASWFHPVFFLGMLALGFVLYLLFPNAIDGVSRTVADAPGRSMLAGMALLFCLPPLAILLMVTIIGLPLAFVVLLAYPLLLLLGYLGAAFALGRKLADAGKQPQTLGKGRQAAFLAAALVVLALVRLVPVVGWFIVFIALVCGMGGWAVWMHGRYRGTSNVGGPGNAGGAAARPASGLSTP